MRKVMRNVILLAAFCAAVPLLAQDQPASSSQQPPKPQAPALENPGTAAPEPAKKPAEIKKPTEDKKPTEAKYRSKPRMPEPSKKSSRASTTRSSLVPN